MANTRKRKAQETANESLPPAKRNVENNPQTQRLPRTRRAETEDVSEEYGDDPPREESQAALATAKAVKQQTKEGGSHLSRLREVVTRQQVSLQSLIEQSRNELTETEAEFQRRFLSCIPANARSSSLKTQSQDDVGSLALSDPASNPLYGTASALLQRSRAMIGIYEQASQLIEQSRPTERPDAEWEQDIDRVSRLLDSGTRIAQRQIQEVLHTPRGKENQALESHESATLLAEATAIFGRSPAAQEGEDSKASRSGPSWAETLVQAEKGVRKMVKGLPEDIA